METAIAQELAGMPEPWCLTRSEANGRVFVFRGPHLFASYDKRDLGMRNLAIVGLTNARFSVGDVAACFGLTPVYVSMLRGRAKHHGSEGLVRRLGRPSSLSAAKLAKARAWSEEGMTNTAIAKRLGVHPGTIGRRLAAVGAGGTSAPVSTETSLFDDEDDGSTDDEA